MVAKKGFFRFLFPAMVFLVLLVVLGNALTSSTASAEGLPTLEVSVGQPLKDCRVGAECTVPIEVKCQNCTTEKIEALQLSLGLGIDGGRFGENAFVLSPSLSTIIGAQNANIPGQLLFAFLVSPKPIVDVTFLGTITFTPLSSGIVPITFLEQEPNIVGNGAGEFPLVLIPGNIQVVAQADFACSYDADQNGQIGIMEARRALLDWMEEKITLPQLYEVVWAWMGTPLKGC